MSCDSVSLFICGPQSWAGLGAASLIEHLGPQEQEAGDGPVLRHALDYAHLSCVLQSLRLELVDGVARRDRARD